MKNKCYSERRRPAACSQYSVRCLITGLQLIIEQVGPAGFLQLAGPFFYLTLRWFVMSDPRVSEAPLHTVPALLLLMSTQQFGREVPQMNS